MAADSARWSKERQNEMIQGMRERARQMGIITMTATREPILLWSHYANSHKGLCMEFESCDPGDAFAAAKEVRYADEYPEVRLFLDTDKEQYDKVVLAKSRAWKYEQEWRIVEPNGTFDYLEFSPENLVSITLGCRMCASWAKRLSEWAARSESCPRVYQAMIHSDAYRLVFEEVI